MHYISQLSYNICIYHFHHSPCNIGSPDAQFSLGQYHFSQGSYETALHYFKAAEHAGSNQARYQLAVMLYDGLGTEQDPVREEGKERERKRACEYYSLCHSHNIIVNYRLKYRSSIYNYLYSCCVVMNIANYIQLLFLS